MIPKKSLMNTVEKYSNDSMFNNCKKVIDELNFEDNLSFKFTYKKNSWIELEFKNSWILTVWDSGSYWLWNCEDDKIIERDYNELLGFMKKRGIRKAEQCEYRDAELYIIDFKNNKSI